MLSATPIAPLVQATITAFLTLSSLLGQNLTHLSTDTKQTNETIYLSKHQYRPYGKDGRATKFLLQLFARGKRKV